MHTDTLPIGAPMYRHTIILPTSVPGMPAAVVRSAHERTERALLARFSGFSATTIIGAWLDDSARVVRDESVRYESLGDGPHVEWLQHLAVELADDLNQDCVLVTAEHVEHVNFVAGTRDSV